MSEVGAATLLAGVLFTAHSLPILVLNRAIGECPVTDFSDSVLWEECPDSPPSPAVALSHSVTEPPVVA